MSRQRILFVGLGGLGSRLFDLLVRVPGQHSFLVGGRNLDTLQQRTNLSFFAAMQLGYHPAITCAQIDLWNKEQTAEVISRFQPDIIVCAATLQHTEAIHDLPRPLAERLATAQLGPRLPLHLVLIYKLMQAVKLTGRAITVLNAIYPDVVGPVLRKANLAPTTGIGDLANNIPALRQAISWSLRKPVEQVEVRLVMARYVSYWMSRRWIGDAPFHLSALLNREELTQSLNLREISDLLLTRLKRTGGEPGLLMTAASAAVVFDSIVNNRGTITHSPGPNGLPGGYPVKIDAQGITVVLPHHLSLETAIQINEAGLRLDGIEKIESDGTVIFTEENMVIFKEVMGYECRRMPLSEVEDRAQELHARYQALAHRYQ